MSGSTGGAKKIFYNAKKSLSGNTGGGAEKLFIMLFLNAKKLLICEGEPKKIFIMLKNFEWRYGGGAEKSFYNAKKMLSGNTGGAEINFIMLRIFIMLKNFERQYGGSQK